MVHKIIEEEKFSHNDRAEGVVKEKDVFATYKHKCKRCGYNYAEVFDLGAQYSDENELIMLKCGRCGYTERIEKKVS